MAQDFHLAKRYYDQAATFDEKAKLPRDIALMMLEVTGCTTLCYQLDAFVRYVLFIISHLICCG